MKKEKNILIVISLILISFGAYSQDSDIKEIRSYYYGISNLIEKKQVYCNQIELNKFGADADNWPALGRYNYKATFWYNTAPAQWDEDGEKSLLKVDEINIYSANSEKREYLYKDGELIFCFINHEDVGEYRFYFANNKLLKYIEKTKTEYDEEIIYNKNSSNDILEDGKRLLKYYLEMF